MHSLLLKTIDNFIIYLIVNQLIKIVNIYLFTPNNVSFTIQADIPSILNVRSRRSVFILNFLSNALNRAFVRLRVLEPPIENVTVRPFVLTVH